MKKYWVNLFLITVVCLGFSQSETAYGTKDETSKPGLLNPSRLSVHHAASFGMSTGGGSGLKSQSLYSTMMQYQFSKPITLEMNFSLPIHSTYNPAFNLNSDNIQSAQYFNSIPVDVSLSWKPRDNFLLRLTVAREPGLGYGYSNQYSPWGMGQEMFNPLFPEASTK